MDDEYLAFSIITIQLLFKASFIYHHKKIVCVDLHKLLSNDKKWSGRRDLNPRPPPPQGGALPSCATARCLRYALKVFVQDNVTKSILSLLRTSVNSRIQLLYVNLVVSLKINAAALQNITKLINRNFQPVHKIT